MATFAAPCQNQGFLALLDVIGRAPLSPEEAVPSRAVPGAMAVPSLI